MAFREPPVIRNGGLPSCDSICAPIIESGLITRSMGLRESDSSPTILEVNDWPATIPLSMRMVEPEFPQSRGADGGASERPLPCTSITLPGPSTRLHLTPRARMQARVLAQSAPVE